MRLALVLIGLFAALPGATGPAQADAPPDAGEPLVERWSADPRLWLALIEWRQRLRLELASSRELCTAGTLTEVSWQIAGGKPPYQLQVEGTPVDADADNIRINCGALAEAEAVDEDAALAAKRITATVTDARGVRREAALDVARARALPPLQSAEEYGDTVSAYRGAMGFEWRAPAMSYSCRSPNCYAIRWRAVGAEAWNYAPLTHHLGERGLAFGLVRGLADGVAYEAAGAAMRDPIELQTPEALRWTSPLSGTTLTNPTGLTATATHDTVTVTWDEQPSVSFFYVLLDDLSGARPRVSDGEIYDPDDHSDGTPTIIFRNVPPDREYTVRVQLGESPEPLLASTMVRTLPAPPGWTAPPHGAQNVRTTTTSNSITVSWDAPYPDAANDDYRLMLFHPTRSGIRHERVYNGTTSYTFDNLEPGLTYRVVVDHVAIVESDVELEATTQSRSTAPSVTPVFPRGR